jgi:hypothetical protein
MNMKIERFIKFIFNMKEANKGASFANEIYISDIPEKKLSNARKTMNVPEKETVLILIDDTVFGSAKDGVLLTDWGIRYKEL